MHPVSLLIIGYFFLISRYDCHLPGYISLKRLVEGTDSEFCEKVAGTSVQIYNAYLKSLWGTIVSAFKLWFFETVSVFAKVSKSSL